MKGTGHRRKGCVVWAIVERTYSIADIYPSKQAVRALFTSGRLEALTFPALFMLLIALG
jgi:hypothetical protein